MTPSPLLKPDPKLDLVLERVVSENPFFIAIVTLEPRGTGTRYTAVAIHRDEAGRTRHAEMGFHAGWGKALDPLVAHTRKM